MKKNIIFILFIISSFCVFGQSKIIYINDKYNHYYSFTQEIVKKSKASNLTNSDKFFHFRIWLFGQAVEVWQNNDSTIDGQILNFTKSYNANNKNAKKKIYFKISKIEKQKAIEVYNLINQVDLINMPCSDSIKGWVVDCTDGYGSEIEFSNIEKYSFKNYYDPCVEDSLIEEVRTLRNFVKNLKSSLNLKTEYNSFTDKLPRGCYNNGSMAVKCKYSKRKAKRIYREYLEKKRLNTT
ncbi:MAG: hypothetical protein ACOYMA_06040 [Bacteroidia bacterium]